MQRLGIQLVNGGGQNIAGSSIYLTVMLVDMAAVQTIDMPTAGTPNPLGPPATVTITLTTPSGQTKVSQAAMTPDGTTNGLYNYTYPSSSTDELGYWYGNFNFADGVGNVGIAPSRPIFQMVGV
jgi:hypothetical protein